MKKILAMLLLLALMLSGCVRSGPSAQQPQPSEDAAPSQQAPANETPEIPEEPSQEASETPTEEPSEEPTEPSSEEPVVPTEPEGELQRVAWAGFMIFSEPSYEGMPVQPLPVGTYTMVDAAQDDEGLHWGKLKSGLGWICLSHIREFNQPVSIGQAEAGLEGACEFSYSEDPYSIYLVIHACEKVTDIQVYTCSLGDEQMEADALIYEKQLLEKNEIMVIRVNFPGDFTTYEVRLTDAAGMTRRYLVSVSGRNGAIAVATVATE